ncbi:MAG: ABC transporter ATP-binding protein [Treponema sp.]|jgi:simple sugar transport system ATP-binding protein|nr:ABC transporter ATP-binding protein [Treponema sp.]
MPEMLKMLDITKRFGNFTANDKVTIRVREGEILALLGENGAGKTTLMNILYGLYKANSGEIRLNDQRVDIENPIRAIELGIGMVHQHFMLIPAFKVWENVALGLKDEQKYFLKEAPVKRKIRDIALRYNLQIDPDAKIDSFSVGLQQQVEIAKVLYRGSRLLILDEPTSVLTPLETRELFKTLRELARGGISVIFISHKLDEVKEISDRVSVLCRGKNADTFDTAKVSARELARLMVGREVALHAKRSTGIPGGEPVLELKDLHVKGRRRAANISGLNLTIRGGEIFGVAGVDGNGQSELIEAITGIRQVQRGRVIICGKDLTHQKPRRLIDNGVAFVPEDRKRVGSVQSFNIERNLILRRSADPGYCRHGLIQYKALAREADAVIGEFDIRYSDRAAPVAHLSGGNLQKLILARELHAKPRLLVAMHPTLGLDVGAIEFIHGKILEARAAGAAVLLVSSELEEILALADSVVVMSNGSICDVLKGDALNSENIGMLMGGLKTEAAGESKIA